jgi:uncharacterized phosphosugar-binding protein
MVTTDYLATVRGILDHLEKTQLGAVEQAAGLVADCLQKGGIVRCSGIGHGLEGDFLNRAGGLAAVQPFTYSFNVNDPGPECRKDRPRPEPFDRELETIRFALRAANVRAGDVMVVGSVSGRNRGPVELALRCRELGVKVVAITALAYTAKVKSVHPSGQRLAEVADVVLDNGAPYGDAAVAIEGFAEKLIPVSGVGTLAVGWLLWGRVMELLAQKGAPPSVYISVNREGGQAFYEKSKAEYNRRGF